MNINISSLFFQPVLLGVAIALIVVALIYKDKASNCNFVDTDGVVKNVGVEIFKVNIGLAIVIVIIAVLINFILALNV